MKIKKKLIYSLSAVVTAGLVIYFVRRLNTCSMLSRISDEGYETAHDVLFPLKENRYKKLHYGPVLPA